MQVKYPIFFACGIDFVKCLALSNIGELIIFIDDVLRDAIGLFVNFGVDGLRRFKTGLLVCLASSLVEYFILFFLDVFDSVVSEV